MGGGCATVGYGTPFGVEGVWVAGVQGWITMENIC